MPIAVAPSASALKMSVPRRKPPSSMIGIRPRTPATTSGNDVIVAASAVFGASAVVRDEDAVDAVQHRQLSVLLRDDALEDHLHGGAALEALHELPCRRAGLQLTVSPTGSSAESMGLRRLSSLPTRPSNPGIRPAAAMTGAAVAAVVACAAQHRQAIAPAQQIDREHDRRTTRALGALDQLLASRPSPHDGRAGTRRAMPRAALASSTDVVATVESTIRWLSALAARATATSPSGWNAFWLPTGLMTIGVGQRLPSSCTDVSILRDVHQPPRRELPSA